MNKIIIKHVFDTSDKELIDLLLYYQNTFNIRFYDLAYLFDLLKSSIVYYINTYDSTYNQYTADVLNKMIIDCIDNDYYLSDDMWNAIYSITDDYEYDKSFKLCQSSYISTLSQMQVISPCITNQYYTIDKNNILTQYVEDDYIISSVYGNLLYTILDVIKEHLPMIVSCSLLTDDPYESDFPETIISKTITGYILYFVFNN